MQILSVFGGGLWLIPVLLFAAIIYCVYRTITVRKGGTVHREKVNGMVRTWYTDDQPPFKSIYSFWCGIILTAALIASLLFMFNE